jgi:hypothetical protein
VDLNSLACKNEYDPPGIGTISPMASRYAEDAGSHFVKQIGSVLENKGLINGGAIPFISHDAKKVRLDDYLRRVPVRKYNERWIDGGKQVAVFHPITNLPFFMNYSGSKISRLCNGKYTIANILTKFRKEWASQKPDNALTKDLMKFLLLMEELGLIEFLG